MNKAFPTSRSLRLIQRINDLGPRFRKIVMAVMVLLLITLIYPFKTIVVPDWSLRVIDEAGAPVRAMNVTEHWQHYLFEDVGHEELRQTGDDGTVKFPVREIRASLVRRLQATLGRMDKTGTEAKTEPYASVVAWGSKTHEIGVALYHEKQAPPSEIVVHTRP